jgi:uncharacterized membrane protein YdjX (TVP38/TMEM64 family)
MTMSAQEAEMAEPTSKPAAGGATSKPSAPRPAWQRMLPLIGMAVVLALVLINGWHRELTLENVATLRERFQDFLNNHKVASLLAYIAVYAGAVALSVPGALILTLSGGLMFGWLFGGAAAVIGASCGAILLFLIARSAFGETLRAKAGPAINGLVEGFRKDALSYLLFLRLVPAVPFFIVNIAAALLGVPLRTYVIGTVFGIIPATFAFASIGAGLDSVIAAAKADQVACLASKAAAACPFELSAKSLVTKEILIALTLLGIVALIPVAYKKWSQRHG